MTRKKYKTLKKMAELTIIQKLLPIHPILYSVSESSKLL
jgi:hypothetical protein